MPRDDLLTHDQRQMLIEAVADAGYPRNGGEQMMLPAIFGGFIAALAIGSVVWGWGDVSIGGLMLLWLAAGVTIHQYKRTRLTQEADAERRRLAQLPDAELLRRARHVGQAGLHVLDQLRRDGVELGGAE